MGEVRVGDELIGADGRPTRVVAATDVMFDRTCYEVEFSDGAVIVADAKHQWVTTTRAVRRAAPERTPAHHYGRPEAIARPRTPASDALRERSQVRAAPGYLRRSLAMPARRVSRPVTVCQAVEHDQVVTTEAMAATVCCESADRRVRHAVRLARPFDLPDADLPLPPYAFGVWLGDGDSTGAVYTSYDPEIATYIQTEGVEVTRYGPRHYRMRVLRAAMPKRPVDGILRSMGVLSDKHIPDVYLRASERQRRALLAGLLDTDGTVDKTGRIQFEVTNRRLAEGTLELIVSLGYHARLRKRRVKGFGEDTSTCYRIAFTPGERVFKLGRKLELQRFEHAPISRTVVDVRRTESMPVRCVEVENADHLYLAGRSCIPTHNSTLGLDIARTAAIRHQLTSVMFSLEMSRNEITMRLLSAEARVPLHHMRSGQMSDDDWNRIARRTGEVSSAPLFIDDSPNMTMMEIRAKCRRLKQRHDLRLVVIDYLQLMTSGKRVESRQQEVAEFSRALKLLAKELDVPVIAISQLNRSAEQRQDKKPMLADLRESGSIEQDSDMVILLHREDAYEKESPRAGEADFIVAKHRNGPTATITVAFQGHYSRFVDMAQ
jgi:replicative DNA helicase